MTSKKRLLLKPLAASLLVLSTSSAMALTDTDSDGMPDQWEQWWGMNSNNPADAAFDNDSDGVTNLQEYTSGLIPVQQDSDGDGVNDNVDAFPTDMHHANDTDSDGMPNGWESAHGLNPSTNDAAMDADADTLTNLQEFTADTDPSAKDTDKDGSFDNVDIAPTNPLYALDSDADGMPDNWETTQSPPLDKWSNDASYDYDGDSLTNLQEFNKKTNPNYWNTDNDNQPDSTDKWPTDANYNFDNDNDDLPDFWEIQNGLNTADPDDARIPFIGDGDFLSPLQEFKLGTNPQSSDTDMDGRDDRHDIDPLVAHLNDQDQDFDGIPAWWEQAFAMEDWNASDAFHDYDGDDTTVLQEYLRGTDPDIAQDQDDDGDGMPNGWEEAHGLNRTYNDGNMNFDADMLTNRQEFMAGTDPMKNDTDHDGINDDTDKWPTNSAYGLDTDNDGLPDQWEVQYSLCPSCPGDASNPWFGDNDQLTPLQEFALGTNPLDQDTDNDSLNDNIDKWPTSASYNFDDDNDGLPNEWEWNNGFNAYNAMDANELMMGDGDRLSPLQEFRLGTNPHQNDTDMDGKDDRHDFNPLVAHMMDEDMDFDGIPAWWEQAFYVNDWNASDAFDDGDNDQIRNWQEYRNGTYPDIAQDQDSDHDGMPNGWEMAHGINPYANNSNQDYDADGLTNLQEYLAGTGPYSMDTDNDGTNDNMDKWPTNAAYSLDTDDDGLPDPWETRYGLCASCPGDASAQWFGDTDQLTPLQEFALGTNPTSNNTDGDNLPDNTDKWPTNPSYNDDDDNDGLPNTWEWDNGFNASNAWDANDVMIGDNDRLSPLQEFKLGTNPRQQNTDMDSADDRHDFDPLVAHMTDEDLDFDGIPAWWEMTFGMDDWNASDAFQDQDSDMATNVQEYQRGTSPDIQDDLDMDHDGMDDGWEAAHGLNPYNKNDRNTDLDSDGLSNSDEFKQETDPGMMDSDLDGINDGDDSWPAESAYALDSDSDGMPDAWEDAQTPPLNKFYAGDANQNYDGDTLNNRKEFEQGSNPSLADSDGDGFADDSKEDLWPANATWFDSNTNGLPDQWETTYFGYPISKQSANEPMFGDNDQLSPVQELELGTNPILNDSDMDSANDRHDKWPTAAGYHNDDDFDGMPSEWEMTYSLNVYNAFDGAQDMDSDGLTNLQEFRFGSAPNNTDSDGDTISDNAEVFSTHTHPGLSDSDGDGHADNADTFPNNASEWIDSDGDGTGNTADSDDDGDGWADVNDAYPLDPSQHDGNTLYPLNGIYKGSTIKDANSFL